MAKALRVDDIISRPDGAIEVRYTFGDPPLPSTWQGSGIAFASRADLGAMITQHESRLADDLFSLLVFPIARWRRLDASMTNTSLIRDKTVTFDPATTGVLSIA